MEVVTLASRKGGVSKTTSARMLGAGLMKEGYSVLYVDLDSQANLTKGLGASATTYSSMDVLNGNMSVPEVIQNTQYGDILAGAEDLDSADAVITGKGKEYRLKDALDAVSGLYDYVIIDTPTPLGILTVNALTAADSVIIPVQADKDSLDGLSLLYKTITTVKKYSNPALYIRGILVTRYDGRTIYARSYKANFEDAAAQLGTHFFSAPIRECVAVREAKDSQQDIFTYAGRSNAARDYSIFIKEFLEKEGSTNNG